MPKVSEPNALKVPDVAVAAVPVPVVERTWTPVRVTCSGSIAAFISVIVGTVAEMS
jgi:hypothetical protein